MATVINPETRAHQMELDLETDRKRLDRLDWERAVDHDLRALQDYVDPSQLIVWKPGAKANRHSAEEVQLTTSKRCTCQRFKLRDRCEHIAFAKELEATGTMPDFETPVYAAGLQRNEAAA